MRHNNDKNNSNGNPVDLNPDLAFGDEQEEEDETSLEHYREQGTHARLSDCAALRKLT